MGFLTVLVRGVTTTRITFHLSVCLFVRLNAAAPVCFFVCHFQFGFMTDLNAFVRFAPCSRVTSLRAPVDTHSLPVPPRSFHFLFHRREFGECGNIPPCAVRRVRPRKTLPHLHQCVVVDSSVRLRLMFHCVQYQGAPVAPLHVVHVNLGRGGYTSLKGAVLYLGAMHYTCRVFRSRVGRI